MIEPMTSSTPQVPASTTNRSDSDTTAAPAAAGCPVQHHHHKPDNDGSAAVDPFVYYALGGKPLPNQVSSMDPANMMPRDLEQTPAPSQRMRLSTKRLESNIPKGSFTPEHQTSADNQDRWVYPSQQQFYNAMIRKGWKPEEKDMRQVLAIHNTVNERAWQEVMRWEALHTKQCDCPRLQKFQGRPRDYSAKARFRSWFGYKLPFDRHDWVVDRCGTEVRYIIDFYNGRNIKNGNGDDNSKPLAIHLDVRPDLQRTENIIDRVWRMPFANLFGGGGGGGGSGDK